MTIISITSMITTFVKSRDFRGFLCILVRLTIGRVMGIRTPLMTGVMLLTMSSAGVLKDTLLRNRKIHVAG